MSRRGFQQLCVSMFVVGFSGCVPGADCPDPVEQTFVVSGDFESGSTHRSPPTHQLVIDRERGEAILTVAYDDGRTGKFVYSEVVP